MYAILKHGGHQYRVTPGDRLLVDRLPAAIGEIIELEPVLYLSGDDGAAAAGLASASGARVAASVVSHRRGKKIRVFKYKPKKRYRKTLGHRSELTELRVEALLAKGERAPASASIAAKAAAVEETTQSESAKPGLSKQRRSTTRTDAAKAADAGQRTRDQETDNGA